jgi:hypothetical protein
MEGTPEGARIRLARTRVELPAPWKAQGEESSRPNCPRERGLTVPVLKSDTGMNILTVHRLRMFIGQYSLRKVTGRIGTLFRKEVIQPQVLLRLPCYDFTPIMSHTLGACPLTVGSATSSTTHFRDVTGGVYKARERIHGVVLIRHY